MRLGVCFFFFFPARKTKCDGVHPTCSSCARRSLACEYVNDKNNHHRDGDTSSGSGRKGVGAGRRPSMTSKVTPATPAPDYSNIPSPPSSRMFPHTPADVYERRDTVMINNSPDADLKRPLEHIDSQPLRPSKKMRLSP
jgi:hypothetical protein